MNDVYRNVRCHIPGRAMGEKLRDNMVGPEDVQDVGQVADRW